jgi:hypothetical protein
MTHEQIHWHEKDIAGSLTAHAPHEPTPDIAFAPPPDDADDLSAARGVSLAIALAAVFWGSLAAWWIS